MTEQEAVKSEFYHFLQPHLMTDEVTELEITANADERAALARRFDLLEVSRLTAKLRVSAREGGRLLRVQGHLSAAVVQACVATLEPVAQTIEAEVHSQFSRDLSPDLNLEVTGNRARAGKAVEILIEIDQEDPLEPLPPEGVDLGEVVVQHFSEHLDPYPRTSGGAAASGFWDDASPKEDKKPNPFAALAALKPKKERP